MENYKAGLRQSDSDLPHTVHVRRVESAAQPRTETFLWRLPVDVVCAKKEAETE